MNSDWSLNMTDEKDKVLTPKPTPEPAKQEQKNVLTFEEATKLAEHKAELARIEAVEEYKRQLQAEKEEAERKQKEAERSTLLEKIKTDEKQKKLFESLNPEFDKASFEWLQGVSSALEFQKKDFQEKNTAKPISTGVVSEDNSGADFTVWIENFKKKGRA